MANPPVRRFGYRDRCQRANLQLRRLAIVAFNRNAQTVKLVEPHLLHGASLSIGEDHGFPYNLCFVVFKCVEDAGCTALERPGNQITRSLMCLRKIYGAGNFLFKKM